MKILFVASEVEPLAKTGGLADVAAALPKSLKALGHDVRIAMPLYRSVSRAQKQLKAAPVRLAISVGSRMLEGRLMQGSLPQTAIPVYFIDQPALFEREGLYNENNRDYPDNLERFSFFSQAVLYSLPQLGWQPDIIHCHDWQASLVPAHLKWGPLSRESFFGKVKTVLTIHNLAYQGVFPKSQWKATQLPDSAFTISGLEFYDQINTLKGGIVAADRLTTVSPTYAREIQTPEFGCSLDGLLRQRAASLTGILNGIDTDAWNPACDKHIAAAYSSKALAGKTACKRDLQKRMKLPQENHLLIGMVQRLVDQKGIDIFIQATPQLMNLSLQIVLLGSGAQSYQQALTQLAERHPERMAVTIGFDNALAHQIEAGSDAFLMASRFEPCGLNQMYSLRYGTLPIVKRVGGLADTVVDLEDTHSTPTGFVFEEHSAQGLVKAATRALAAYQDRQQWKKLMRAAMQQDFSWNASAAAYLKIYQEIQGPLKPAAKAGKRSSAKKPTRAARKTA